jgi:hypothetical protein
MVSCMMDIKRNRSLLASSKPHLHRCRRINEMKSRRGRKLLLLLFVLIDIVLTKDTNNAGEHAKLGPTITSKACFRAMPPKMSHLKMCLVLTLRSAPIMALRLLCNAQILSYPSLIGYGAGTWDLSGTCWRSIRLRKQSGKRGGNCRGAEGEPQKQPLGEGASLSHSPRQLGGEETLKIPNRCR